MSFSLGRQAPHFCLHQPQTQNEFSLLRYWWHEAEVSQLSSDFPCPCNLQTHPNLPFPGPRILDWAEGIGEIPFAQMLLNTRARGTGEE